MQSLIGWDNEAVIFSQSEVAYLPQPFDLAMINTRSFLWISFRSFFCNHHHTTQKHETQSCFSLSAFGCATESIVEEIDLSNDNAPTSCTRSQKSDRRPWKKSDTFGQLGHTNSHCFTLTVPALRTKLSLSSVKKNPTNNAFANDFDSDEIMSCWFFYTINYDAGCRTKRAAEYGQTSVLS